jgi:DNA-binding NarL/FixJ family response regulator
MRCPPRSTVPRPVPARMLCPRCSAHQWYYVSRRRHLRSFYAERRQGASPGRPYPGPVGGLWPLTGRTEELRFLIELTRTAGGPGGAVLSGAAGVGKTRLAREAAAVAGLRGATVRWFSATASAGALPLGAFAGVFDSSDAEPAAAARRALQARDDGSRGVLVVVDDAHLLDELSATLVHDLVTGRALSVLLTLRTGERAPAAVTAIWREDHLPRLELQPLGLAEMTTLLEAVLGGPVDDLAARRFWTTSGGNSLFLRQLVDGEREAGRLAQVAGVWLWSGQPELTPGLVELVAARVGALSTAELGVVEALAFAEPLEAEVLRELAGAPAVERTAARGVIETYTDGNRVYARLAHPLFGEVQRARIGHLRARRIRGRVATAVLATGARRADDTLRRAVLAMESDLPADPVLLTTAARRAAALTDLALAERLARAAIAAGGGFDARLTLASAVVGMSGSSDAELADAFAHASTDAERATATILRATQLFWVAARPAEAEAVVGAAESMITDPDAARELAAFRVTTEASLGRPARATEIGRAVLAAPALSAPGTLYACCGLVIALAALGRSAELGALVARAEAAVAEAPDLEWLMGPVAWWYVLGLRAAGRVPELAAAAVRFREGRRDAPLAAEVGTVAAGYGQLGRGQVAAAVRLLREARAGLARYGLAGGWLFCCLIELSRALALSGDAAAARETATAMEAAWHPAFVVLRPEMLLAKAWVAAAEGALTEAVALTHEAADVAAAAGQPAHEVSALQVATCFGDRTVAPRLAALVAVVDGPRAPVAAAHAAALADGDGDALLAASERAEVMGDLLVALDAAAQAAAVHGRRGHRGPARLAMKRAHRLARACEGATTPALLAASAPVLLTAREREVVTMAAAGLTNREIADRLAVSVRTVEGHIYRASAKLGVSDRADLAGLIRGP